MKKILEAELMSLAHQILKLKNKSDLHTAYEFSEKLNKKLAILLFLEEHATEIKPTLSTLESQQKVIDIINSDANKKIDEKETPVLSKPEPTIVEPVVKEPIIEPKTTTVKKAIAPAEPTIAPVKEQPTVSVEQPKKEQRSIGLNFDSHPSEEKKPESQPKKDPKVVDTIDDFFETLNPPPTFVKAEKKEEKIPIDNSSISFERATPSKPKKVSINDKLKKSITIGLNDKIAFVKHLFDGNNADFIRVISQVNTLDNFEEAKDFIQMLVKPDHDNWMGKEEVEERFMHIIENKFS